MEQQKALNALEPFVALSKSANSARAAADLITQATSAPNTFVFAELLQTPNIQALRQSPEHAAYLKLLEIFAWGTYEDYKATQALPPLNPQQTTKLQLLSLLPLLSNTANPAANSRHNVTYAYLQPRLGVPSDRALESLLARALSSSLITGHLDPRNHLIAVTSVSPLRDLPPGSVGTLVGTLGDWEARCDGTLAELDARIAAIRDNAARRGERERRRAAAFEAELERDDPDAKGRGAGRGAGKRSAPMADFSGVGEDDEDAMDVDEGVGGAGAGGGGSGASLARGAKKLFSKGR